MLTPFNLERKVALLWIFYIIAVCIILAGGHFVHSLTDVYMNASNAWFAGNVLYNPYGTKFIYFPQSAILFSPFRFFPFHVSEITWRILSMGLFAIGVFRLASLNSLNLTNKYFLWMTLVCLPLAFSSARNGQMNVMIAALMMFAIYALSKENWWSAAFYLTLAVAFKPTSVVLWLLILGLYPVMVGRLILGLTLIAILPFFTQKIPYVLSQYQACLTMLQTAANLGSRDTSWAQIFGLLGILKIVVAPSIQYVLRIITAAVTYAACFWVKKRFPAKSAPFYIYTLAIIYLMLFNPRTENNDYIIFAPLYGFVLAEMFYRYKSLLTTVGMLTLLLLMCCSYEISQWLTAGYDTWLSPTGAICLGIIVFKFEFLPKLMSAKDKSTHYLIQD